MCDRRVPPQRLQGFAPKAAEPGQHDDDAAADGHMTGA
jgi:hypothetical protein